MGLSLDAKLVSLPGKTRRRGLVLIDLDGIPSGSEQPMGFSSVLTV